MNIKIGAIIKKLRAENNITQDALATAVGVTPQAISRWEAESGYPDIELLPVLADFFSVSVDELIGYRLSEREKELADIKKELERLSEVGSVEERVAYARNAFTRSRTTMKSEIILRCACILCGRRVMMRRLSGTSADRCERMRKREHKIRRHKHPCQLIQRKRAE